MGVLDPIIAARPTATAFTTASYLNAVAVGADSFCVPDHLNALFPRAVWNERYCGAAKILSTADAYLEPWTMLGRLSARNRIGRLYLGVGVTDTGRRNPAVTAQAAAMLHLLTRGRAILGIGPGERDGNEPYGVDWTKPVARFEEALATIRILWNSGGELVNRDSPYFPLRNAIFDLPRIEGRGPRSVLVRTDPACCAWWAATQMAIPWVPPPPTRLRTSSGDRPRGSLRRRAGPNVAGAGSDARSHHRTQQS